MNSAQNPDSNKAVVYYYIRAFSPSVWKLLSGFVFYCFTIENKPLLFLNFEWDTSPVSESVRVSASKESKVWVTSSSHPYSRLVSRGDSCHHFPVTNHQGSLSVKFNHKTWETIKASLPVGTLSAETLVASPGTRWIPSTTVCSRSQVGCSLHVSLCYWSMNWSKSMSHNVSPAYFGQEILIRGVNWGKSGLKCTICVGQKRFFWLKHIYNKQQSVTASFYCSSTESTAQRCSWMLLRAKWVSFKNIAGYRHTSIWHDAHLDRECSSPKTLPTRSRHVALIIGAVFGPSSREAQ